MAILRPHFRGVNAPASLRLLTKAIFDKDRLGAEQTSGLMRRLRPKLTEVGTEAFPIISFIAKSELRDRDLEALQSY